MAADRARRHRERTVTPQTNLTQLRKSADRYRRGGPLKRLLSLLLGLLLVFVLLELLVRFGLGSSPRALRTEMTGIVSAISESVPDEYREKPQQEQAQDPLDETIERIVPHPFTGWDDQSSLQRVERDIARSAELRADPVAARQTYRVLVSGGSVALLFRRRGAKVMADELEASGVLGERKVEFLHYARAAFKQPQQVDQLAYLLAMGIEPDLVIDLDGYNELAISHRNQSSNTHPGYPAIRFWGHVAGGRGTDPEELDLVTAIWTRQRAAQHILAGYTSGLEGKSALAGELRLRQLRALRAEWIEAQARYTDYLASSDSLAPVRGPAYAGTLEEELAFLRRMWVESSRSMHAMCAARGIAYLHVLQPTLADASSGKPLAEFERGQLEAYRLNAADRAFEAVQLGYDELREGGRDLSAAGIEFLDATRAFEGMQESLYTDFVHFDRVGNERLGRLIAERLTAMLRR